MFALQRNSKLENECIFKKRMQSTIFSDTGPKRINERINERINFLSQGSIDLCGPWGENRGLGWPTKELKAIRATTLATRSPPG